MKRVLLVNDNTAITERTAAMLEEIGCEVYTANDREHVESSCMCNQPDTAIIDVEMSGGEGFELMSLIRRTRPTITIIAVTRGAHEDLWPMVARACGASEYVTGPVSAHKLLNAVSPPDDR